MKKKIKQSTLILILNAASIFALLFMLFLLFCYSDVNEKIDYANEERFDLTYNANRFMNGSSYLTNEVRAYAATGNQKHYDNYWNEINNLKNRDIGIDEMEKIGITGEEQQMIDEMSGLSNNLVPLEEEAMENVQAGKKDVALEYVYGEEYSESIAQINQIKSEFLGTLDERAHNEVTRQIRIADSINILLYLSAAVVVVLQVLTSYFTRRRIIAPIVTIQNEMGEISQGNLSADFLLESNTSEIGILTEAIHVTKRELKKYITDIDDTLAQMAEGNMNLTIGNDYRGEFLPIQNAMRTIIGALNRALMEINSAADRVAAGSESVAESSQELSHGAAEQTVTVRELSGNIKVLGKSLESIASIAQEARNSSVSASHQLKLSNEKMDELSSAISNISEASGQVGGIIKMIEDLAFQTNILALNAAVEAARAGNAGKGFAVVADEVRNLAAKSSDAAKSTTVLIENILKQIHHGAEYTTQTKDTLFKVVAGAKQSTDLVEKIASETNRQLETLDEVTNGITTISGVVESNAAAAEGSAASAQELSSQAIVLKKSVERFKLHTD